MNSEGLTPTEKYLVKLGRKSFLSLWSHANLYRDMGKELADLTVICGRHVILFSDKKVGFDLERDINVSWQRWYNRAVNHSAKQLLRARGWLTKHKDRIFLDANCSNPANLFERVSEPLEIHLVAVANGASEACLRYFSGGSGSLVVCPEESPNSPDPFCVGNPGGEKAFVHVFDEINLNVVLQELDTIGDFLGYLRSRERLFEQKRVFIAHSEEDLLAFYLKNINEKGEHDFVFDGVSDDSENQFFVIEEGFYLGYSQKAEYKRKKKADKISYFWDNLIESFAKNLVAGSLAKVPEDLAEYDGSDGGAEIGLRYMALEPRIMRRAHSEAIFGAFDSLQKSKGERFFRAMLPPANAADKTAFFVLLLERNGRFSDWTYGDYRRYRALAAHAYAENLLLRNPEFERVIGIATEGERGQGRSEDLLYHEQIEWTTEAIKQAEKSAEVFDIFRQYSEVPYSTEEYPRTDLGIRGGYAPIPYRFYKAPEPMASASFSGNRAQRRRQAAKSRRAVKQRR